MSDIGLILLAAGGSSRMGRPKQLLEYRGRTLLRRAVDAALQSGCSPIVVVIGAQADAVTADLAGLDNLLIQPNPNWEQGMGTSIVAGLQRLLSDQPNLAAAVIMLCDQPHVDARHVRHLCQAHKDTGKGVIASGFSGTAGSPCLFAEAWFGHLLRLEPAHGAKKVIEAAANDRVVLPCPQAARDIDTPEDFERLLIP